MTLSVAALSAALSAKPAAPASRPGALDPKLFDVKERVLANGLKVRLLADHAVPTITYYTFFRVGSRNERPGITGISHLFEHMMFNGAKKYGPKEFDRALESRGGYSNAYTSNDLTAYYEDFQSGALATVVDLESDRMRSLALTEEALKSEREVVKEERRLRTDNDIGGLLSEQLEATMYVSSPYHWPVVGWMSDLDRITRQDCVDYFRMAYAPNNATVVVVGDLDVDKTFALIEEHYADIPAGPPLPPVAADEAPQRGERVAFVKYPAQAAAAFVGYKATAASDPDTPVLDVIQAALGFGEGARLKRALVYGAEVAVNVGVDFGWRIDPAPMTFSLEVKPGDDPARAQVALYLELSKVVHDGLTEAELDRAKNILKASFLREIATHNGRAHVLGEYEVWFGDWRRALTAMERYDAVTAADVKRVAAKVFNSERRTSAILVPIAEEEQGAAGEAGAHP